MVVVVGVAPVTDPWCQSQSRRRPFLFASCPGRARSICAVLGNPGRAGLRDGWRCDLSVTGLGVPVPSHPSRGLGELGGARAGAGSPQSLAQGWGWRRRECAARVSECAGACAPVCARRALAREVRGFSEPERLSGCAAVRKSGCIGARVSLGRGALTAGQQAGGPH